METFYYIIKEAELTNEEYNGGYTLTKESIPYKIVPFTVNTTFKQEYVYTLEEWSNFGFDVIEDVPTI